jgi:hypothetical protein
VGIKDMSKVAISITINVTDDGKVGMVGPLHDKVLCFGLLEVAKDIVREHKSQQPSTIIPMNGRIPGLI